MQKRKVCQYDRVSMEPLQTFNSIREAQEAYHVSHISEVCHGKRKTDGGYIWRYLDDGMGRTYVRQLKK